MNQYSYIIIKPDGLHDSEFLKQFYSDLKEHAIEVLGTKRMRLTMEQAQQLYPCDVYCKNEWFTDLYPMMLDSMTSGDIEIIKVGSNNEENINEELERLKGRCSAVEGWHPETGHGWRVYAESHTKNRVHSPCDDIEVMAIEKLYK